MEKRITVRLDDQIYASLQDYCEEDDRLPSAVARRALIEWLKREGFLTKSGRSVSHSGAQQEEAQP